MTTNFMSDGLDVSVMILRAYQDVRALDYEGLKDENSKNDHLH